MSAMPLSSSHCVLLASRCAFSSPCQHESAPHCLHACIVRLKLPPIAPRHHTLQHTNNPMYSSSNKAARSHLAHVPVTSCQEAGLQSLGSIHNPLSLQHPPHSSQHPQHHLSHASRPPPQRPPRQALAQQGHDRLNIDGVGGGGASLRRAGASACSRCLAGAQFSGDGFSQLPRLHAWSWPQACATARLKMTVAAMLQLGMTVMHLWVFMFGCADHGLDHAKGSFLMVFWATSRSGALSLIKSSVGHFLHLGCCCDVHNALLADGTAYLDTACCHRCLSWPVRSLAEPLRYHSASKIGKDQVWHPQHSTEKMCHLSSRNQGGQILTQQSQAFTPSSWLPLVVQLALQGQKLPLQRGWSRNDGDGSFRQLLQRRACSRGS